MWPVPAALMAGVDGYHYKFVCAAGSSKLFIPSCWDDATWFIFSGIESNKQMEYLMLVSGCLFLKFLRLVEKDLWLSLHDCPGATVVHTSGSRHRETARRTSTCSPAWSRFQATCLPLNSSADEPRRMHSQHPPALGESGSSLCGHRGFYQTWNFKPAGCQPALTDIHSGCTKCTAETCGSKSPRMINHQNWNTVVLFSDKARNIFAFVGILTLLASNSDGACRLQ